MGILHLRVGQRNRNFPSNISQNRKKGKVRPFQTCTFSSESRASSNMTICYVFNVNEVRLTPLVEIVDYVPPSLEHEPEVEAFSMMIETPSSSQEQIS